MAAVIRIGTRASQLAMAQTRLVLKALKKRNPGERFMLVTIHSQGDQDQTFGLFKKGQIGVFTKALEKQLLNKQIDIAVHSLKDLPTTLPPQLTIGAYPKRASACDVLISKKKWDLRSLPAGSIVGTGSPRRKRQLLKQRPDVVALDMRGNLDTRVRKALTRDGVDAVLVADAGLERIGRYRRYACRLKPEIFLPAVGQGALALEIRSSDGRTKAVASKLNHEPTEWAVTAERAFLKKLQGGCRVPVGIHTKISSRSISMTGSVFSVEDHKVVSAKISGNIKKRIPLAQDLAKKLLRMGASTFLREARK